MEKLTSRLKTKKWAISCRIPPALLDNNNAAATPVTLQMWMIATYGVGAKFRSKAQKAAQHVNTAPLRPTAVKAQGSTLHVKAPGIASTIRQEAAAKQPRERMLRLSSIAAEERLASYAGWGMPPLGHSGQIALGLAQTAAGSRPQYIWPQQAPQALGAELIMGDSTIEQRVCFPELKPHQSSCTA